MICAPSPKPSTGRSAMIIGRTASTSRSSHSGRLSPATSRWVPPSSTRMRTSSKSSGTGCCSSRRTRRVGMPKSRKTLTTLPGPKAVSCWRIRQWLMGSSGRRIIRGGWTKSSRPGPPPQRTIAIFRLTIPNKTLLSRVVFCKW